jgi:uncharacterized protein YjdB
MILGYQGDGKMKKYLFSAMAALVLLASKLGCSGDSHTFIPPAAVKPASVEISPNSSLGPIELKKDAALRLTAKVLPENADDKSVTWQSSDPTKAYVANGLVTAVSKGDTFITATAVNGVSDFVHIRVTVDVESVRIISSAEQPIEIEYGGTIVLTAEVLPADASDKRLIWESDDPSTASVFNAGQVTEQTALVTGNKAGIATITARSVNGEKKGSCEVEVLDPPFDLHVPVASIALSPSSLELTKGDEETIVAIVLPVNATDKRLTWESSNPDVASVDEDTGLIRALEIGTALIWATNIDEVSGEKVVSFPPCAVTVSDHIEYIAGNEIVENISVAKYWMNGSPVPLSDGTGNADAKSIAVSTVGGRTTVFVAGDEMNNDNISVAKVWINRTAVQLGNGVTNSQANSVYANGDDYRVVGYENDGEKDVPTLWLNGRNPIRLPVDGGGDAVANCVTISNNIEYVAGQKTNSDGRTLAMIWIGGSSTYLTDGGRNASANSVFVIDTEVWVAGWENNAEGVPMAALWKMNIDRPGTEKINLPTTRTSLANSVYVTATEVDGDITYNIHVAGSESNGLVQAAVLWEGTTSLSRRALDTGGTESMAYSVFVDSQDNVYAAGYKENSSFAPEARVWKNGLEKQPIPSASIAKAIAVK